MLRRTVRETDKASARLKLKRYAPRQGPEVVNVFVEETDGVVRPIYGDGADTG